jgi:spore coat protein H
VHFRINDRYYGVMHSVERIGAPFLRRWGMADTGSLYEADPPLELGLPGGNLTPLRPELYPQVYQHHAGSIDYADLRKLIEETLTLPDPEFAAIAEREIMVDEYIQYLAALAAIQDQDQVRKNYYLYRDPQGSDPWRVIPWDLDLTFGHLWSEQNDVLEEQIVTDSDLYVGTYEPTRGDFYNQLTERVLRVPAYRARFREAVQHMLDTSMSRAEASQQLQAAVRCMTPDLVADQLKRSSNAEYQARVTEILDFLDARRAYVGSLP